MSLLIQFIVDIEKLTSPNDKKLALHQGNGFFDVYKTFFDKIYGWCIKDLLPISIAGTQATASTFARWYIGVTDPDETELKTGKCEVHKFNVSTTRWREF